MSIMTREDMLRELELLPAWQLRVPVQEVKRPLVSAEESLSVAVLPDDVESAANVQLESAMVTEQVVEQVSEGAESLLVRAEQVSQMDWQRLQQCVQNCQACPLSQTRAQTVFGVGDVGADWMFVGEAPGADEDRQGEPFMGQAGKLLDNMLAAIKLKRGQHVYITNVLKCRPPENRDPHVEEVMQCELYLKRQVELIQPKLIIALGKVAAQTLLKSDVNVSSMRGQLHDYHDVPVIVTYHPAYLLRNPADKAKVWEDLCFAKDTIQHL